MIRKNDFSVLFLLRDGQLKIKRHGINVAVAWGPLSVKRQKGKAKSSSAFFLDPNLQKK
jgi:hypothetical protein